MLRPTSTVLFNKLLPRFNPDLVCEIGSRDGFDAIKLKKLCPSARVISFESDPDNFQVVEKNIDYSGLDISVYNTAMSNKVKYLSFYRYNKPGLSSFQKRKDMEPSNEIAIQANRLGDILAQKNLASDESYNSHVD